MEQHLRAKESPPGFHLMPGLLPGGKAPIRRKQSSIVLARLVIPPGSFPVGREPIRYRAAGSLRLMQLPQQRRQGIAQPPGIFQVLGENTVLPRDPPGRQPVPLSRAVGQHLRSQSLAVEKPGHLRLIFQRSSRSHLQETVLPALEQIHPGRFGAAAVQHLGPPDQNTQFLRKFRQRKGRRCSLHPSASWGRVTILGLCPMAGITFSIKSATEKRRLEVLMQG